MTPFVTDPGPALVAKLLDALRDESDALKCGSVARAALADGRKRCLLRLLMTGAPERVRPGPLNA